jgi:acyl transferase domain-containing protein/aryl carrier-like protein
LPVPAYWSAYRTSPQSWNRSRYPESPTPTNTPVRLCRSDAVATPATGRAEILADAIAVEVGAILGMEPSEIDRRLGFFDAGMDSLMAVDLAKRLKQALEAPLPATVAFDHPSIDALVVHILDTLSFADGAPAAAPATVAAAERRIDLDEPIAVIGISCRMPGGANDPEAFWELLRSGRDPIRPVPPDRWDLSGWYDPRQGTLGKMYVREAGFVDQEVVEGFDPEFFGISPREAESMDPQQRMLLEVSYEALERAGVATASLRHSRTGVFVGVGDSGYLDRFQDCGDVRYADQYAGTGNLSAFVSGRVAYVLGLHGPNLALNTACSSSLVALHLACQALRTGEAELALAGGVHLMLSPENFVYVSQIKAVSPDGRCKTFDARADGYGRAEGCGMVVLKRLSEAQRDGDPVLAVVRGTACGHDGPSSGLTVPYGPAQVQVLSDAIGRSGIHPHEVSYLEAHGTGTVLGDPIEVHAAEEVYCQGRDPKNPLHLGAVKAHVGHLEVAAGAASLVKMVLALQHRQIPPHLHFRSPNPDLDLDANRLVIDTELTPWSPPSGHLVAGISGFGLAGTNVHVVVEEPPAAPPRVRPGRPERASHVLPLSARSPEALRALASKYGQLLEHGHETLPDVAFSAATTRNAYEHRLAVVAPDAAEMVRQLASFVATGDAPMATAGQAAGRPPKVAFLFSGQGSQYPGMGRALYDTFPVYRDMVDRSAAVLDPLLPKPLLDVLFGEGEEVHDTTWTQPALFVIETAMAALWASFGVTPSLVLGHSIGQIAAACVAGVFSLEDGLRLVAARGRLMGALPREGTMVAVFADEATVTEAIAAHRGEVGIAGLNNPGETVISGRTETVQEIAAALRAKKIETRDLTVSHAFHSPLMAPMLDAFEAEARKVTYRRPTIPVVCNLTGAIAGDELLDAAYWRSLAASPVRYADGLLTVEQQGIGVFLEVGPHTALLGMGRRTLPDRTYTWLPSLQRNEDALSRLLPSLGALWVKGVAVDWKGYDAPWARNRVALPTHPWSRRRIWLDKPEFPQMRRSSDGWLVRVDWQDKTATPAAPTGTWKVHGDASYATEIAERGGKLGNGGSVLLAVAPGADPLKTTWRVLELVRDLPEGARLAIVGPAEAGFAAPVGLLRAARAERAVDTVAVTLEGDVPVNAIVDAVLSTDGEPEVRLAADGTRRVRRLDRTTTTGAMPDLPEDGAVLVTGGLGGIGLAAARWLGEHGARHLVLTGRSAPSAEAEAVIEGLRDKGVGVVVDRGDVAERADVDRIVGAVRARGHKLVGVVHAAGVLADAALANQDEAGLRKVFGPKVAGATHFAAATASDPLRFLVFFAAGAGLMGSPGQANYAAANAFQDALAHELRAAGRPALSIDWGAWAEVGMAARLGEGHAERQASEGISRIPLQEGLDLFGRLLGHDAAQVAVLPVDWPLFVQTMHKGTAPPLLERLARVAAPAQAGRRASNVIDADAPPTSATTNGAAQTQPELIRRLAGVDRSAWAPVVETYIGEQAIRILRFPKEKVLDPELPLLDVGLDSLLAVELKNAIMDGGVDLAVARVMTGPPIRQIGQMVLTVLDERPPVAVEAARPDVITNGDANGDAAPPLSLTYVWVFLAGAVISPVVMALVYVLSVRVMGYEQTAYSTQEVEDQTLAAEQAPPAAKSKTPKRAKAP